MIYQRKNQLTVRKSIVLILLLITIGSYGQEISQDDDLTKSITGGEFVFNGKLRFWHANDEAARASQAYTFGTNFGYKTKSYKGFQVYLEGESVVALTPDRYFDGINGLTDRTNVTDPETLELNQAHIEYNSTYMYI